MLYPKFATLENLKMIKTKFAAMLMLLPLVSLHTYADIYKYKDSDGKWRYTDVPPRGDVKYDVLSKKKVDDTKNTKIMTKAEVLEATSPAKNDKAAPGEKKAGEHKKDKEKEKAEAEKIKAAEQAVAQENAAIKQENCSAAKANLATYQQGGRIRKVNEKGESTLLGDAEIAAGRLAAQKEVDQYCSS